VIKGFACVTGINDDFVLKYFISGYSIWKKKCRTN